MENPNKYMYYYYYEIKLFNDNNKKDLGCISLTNDLTLRRTNFQRCVCPLIDQTMVFKIIFCASAGLFNGPTLFLFRPSNPSITSRRAIGNVCNCGKRLATSCNNLWWKECCQWVHDTIPIISFKHLYVNKNEKLTGYSMNNEKSN